MTDSRELAAAAERLRKLKPTDRKCDECRGTGQCDRCDGDGRDPDMPEECFGCDGTGRCDVCAGKGIVAVPANEP